MGRLKIYEPSALTPRGNKPCLSPLLAVLAEARMVAQFWLRPGNVHSATNVINFTLDLLSNLPRHIRVRLIRADSGFYRDDWLSLLETQGLGYIVVAELQIKLQRLIRKETRWQAGKVVGTEVAEVLCEGASGRQRRMILVRHRISEKKRAGGKYLFECPGYRFQALGHKLVSQCRTVGCLVGVQWASRSGKYDQGTGLRLRLIEVVLQEILGNVDIRINFPTEWIQSSLGRKIRETFLWDLPQ